MGLDDPTKKMSKSALGSYHAVRVLDTPEQIRKTVMSAQTDSNQEIRLDLTRPGVANLLAIYMAATGETREQAEAHFANARGYGDLKKELAADPATVRDILRCGAEKVTPIARQTTDAAKLAMGVGS